MRSKPMILVALLLTFGSLSDRSGRKGMLLAGLTVFGTASLAGGFTSSPAQLIAARSVMGLGAAMAFPATLSLISNVFTERRERARGIGLWGAIAGVAIAMGPIVGGWLLEHFSWASIFIAMAPVHVQARAVPVLGDVTDQRQHLALLLNRDAAGVLGHMVEPADGGALKAADGSDLRRFQTLSARANCSSAATASSPGSQNTT
jgi:MFS family permease